MGTGAARPRPGLNQNPTAGVPPVVAPPPPPQPQPGIFFLLYFKCVH